MGCNFRCRWCSSPQTFEPVPVLLIHSNLERHPNRIAASCPFSAITIENGRTETDRIICAKCGSFDCVSRCIDGSREIAGVETSVEEVISEVIQYKRFHPNYGLTLSGGEPTCQWNFYIELLKAAKERGLHTAVETNASSDRLPESLPFVDLFICDLKHTDDARHRELTGCSNATVLKNIKTIAESGHPLWVRIPVVPGINDGDNLVGSAEFLFPLKERVKVELLGYHRLGVHNWDALGAEYKCADAEPMTEEMLDRARDIFRSRGLEVITT